MNHYLIRFTNTSDYVDYKDKRNFEDGFHKVDGLTVEILNTTRKELHNRYESSNHNGNMETPRSMGNVQAKNIEPKENKRFDYRGVRSRIRGLDRRIL